MGIKVLWENVKWDRSLAGRHLVWEHCRTVGGGAVVRVTKQASAFDPEEVDRTWYEVKAPPHLEHLELCDFATCSGLFDEPYIAFDCLNEAIRFAGVHARMKAVFVDGMVRSYTVQRKGV